MRVLLACLLAVAANAVTWSAKDEQWLKGEIPSSHAVALDNLHEGGIMGRWDSHYVDYDNQDKFLAKLGVSWATRTAIGYSKPTFRFAKKELSSKQIDSDNKATVPSAAGEKVPILEMKTEILHVNRLLDARIDGQEFHMLDEQVGVEWTIRTNLLPDGRFLLVRRHDDKGVIRELRAALNKDPKGEQSGHVLLYEAHFEPQDNSAELSNTMWLHENSALAHQQFLQ